MDKLKNKKGITLIALVITVIVLLILAGVSIAMLTGDNGILTKASSAKEKSSEEEAREKVKLMLSEWKMENTIKNISLDDFLMNIKYEENRKSYNVDSVNKDGIYYIATVNVGNVQYNVDINAQDIKNPYIEDVYKTGKKFKISTLLKNYKFNESVDIEVVVVAPQGETITKIEFLDENGNVTVLDEVTGMGEQTANATITVTEDGKYKFRATSNLGETKECEFINVIIASTPQIDISNITYNSFQINISNKIDNENVQYKYYVQENGSTEWIEQESNVAKKLKCDMEYKVKVTISVGDEKEEKIYDETVTTLNDESWVIPGREHNISAENELIGTAAEGRKYYKSYNGAAIAVTFSKNGTHFALVSKSAKSVIGYCTYNSSKLSTSQFFEYNNEYWAFSIMPYAFVGGQTAYSCGSCKYMGSMYGKSNEEIFKLIMADYFIEDANIEITDRETNSFKINLKNTKEEYQYEYYIKKKTDSTWTKIDSNEATGLEEMTEYNVKVITNFGDAYKENIYDNTVKTKMTISWDENGNPYNVTAADSVLGTAGGRTYYKKYDGNAVAFVYSKPGAIWGLISKDPDAVIGWCTYSSGTLSTPVSFEYNNETWYYAQVPYGFSGGAQAVSSRNCPYIGTVSVTGEELAKLVLDMIY